MEYLSKQIKYFTIGFCVVMPRLSGTFTAIYKIFKSKLHTLFLIKMEIKMNFQNNLLLGQKFFLNVSHIRM